MEQSILKSVKMTLGVGDDDTAFDFDIITKINSAFSTLNDIGIGPSEGFVIEDDTTEWAEFLADDEEMSKVKLSKVKDVVWLHTKLRFDPPSLSFHLAATEKQLEEALWRLNVNREELEWVDPDPETELAGFGLVGFGTGGFGL